MTFEQAQKLKLFWDDYYDNCFEREQWGDPVLTLEQFFNVWLRRDEDAIPGEMLSRTDD